MDYTQRITVNPLVCFGKPCIRGHRIWVAVVLDLLAAGETPAEICSEYGLEDDDIRACLGYAAAIADERIVEVRPSA